MVTLLVASLALQTINLFPTDDIWVYAHASDPGGDSVMRVWGIDGDSVPSSATDAESFSMGYLKFSLADVPSGLTLKGAHLIVHQAPSPGYTLEQSKAAPLEARLIPANFSEKTWSESSIEETLPKKDDLALGSAPPDSIEGDDVTISIDLMKNADALKKALAGKEIAIALTTTMDASALGRAAIYRIYSREEKDEHRVPKLVLDFD